MISRAAAFGATAMALGAPAVLRAREPYAAEYRMSTVVPPPFAWGRGGEIFARLVRERTDGAINIRQYPGASLVQGQQDREFAAMRQGVIDVLCGAPVNWSTTVPEFGLFALPFLMPDHRAFDAVIGSDFMAGEFFELVRRNGAEPLAVGETGYRQLSNSRRPVVEPRDLAELKIRVTASPMFIDIMQGMSANPVSMSWADAMPALASRAVDGQENPLEVFLTARIDKLAQRYVTKWNYSNDVLLFAVADRAWRSWRPEHQRIVRQAARDAAREQIQLVRALFAEDVMRVSALGVEVHLPTPVQMERWHTAVRRPYARWKARIGPRLVEQVERIVAQAAAPAPARAASGPADDRPAMNARSESPPSGFDRNASNPARRAAARSSSSA